MICSKRRTLEEYIAATEKMDQSKDKSVANLSAKYVDSEIEPNTVFVLNYTKSEEDSLIEGLARELKEYKVYCSYTNRKRFEDCEHIAFVKKNSEEFFAVLNSSQFILTDTELSTYFVPKEGQQIISVIDKLDENNFASVVNWTKIILKSTAITTTKENIKDKFNSAFPNMTSYNGDFLGAQDIAEYIRGGEISSKIQESTKKKILIIAQFDNYELWVKVLTNYLDNIDFATNEITLVLDVKQVPLLEKFIKPYLRKVNIVLRNGWFLISEDIRKIYDYINTDLVAFEEPLEIYDYVSKDIYRRELQRIVGNHSYDAIVLYGDRLATKNYWLNIARALEKIEKHIVYSNDLYKLVTTDAEVIQVVNKTATSLYLEFDNIWFWNQKAKEEFVSMAKELHGNECADKGNLISVLPTSNVMQTSLIELNNENNIVYNDFYNEGHKIHVVKAPGENAIGIVLEKDEDCTKEKVEALKSFIKKNETREVFIFDINGTQGENYSSLLTEYSEVYSFEGALYYYVYLNYVKEYVLLDEGSARKTELKNLGKKIVEGLE